MFDPFYKRKVDLRDCKIEKISPEDVLPKIDADWKIQERFYVNHKYIYDKTRDFEDDLEIWIKDHDLTVIQKKKFMRDVGIKELSINELSILYKPPYVIVDFRTFHEGWVLIRNLKTLKDKVRYYHSHFRDDEQSVPTVHYLKTGFIDLTIEDDPMTKNFLAIEYSTKKMYKPKVNLMGLSGLQMTGLDKWGWCNDDNDSDYYINRSGRIEDGHLIWERDHLDYDFDLVSSVLAITRSKRPKYIKAKTEIDVHPISIARTTAYWSCSFEQIFCQSESWYDEWFKDNSMKRTSYLADRLNAILLTRKIWLLQNDRKLTKHPDFSKYMMMTEEDLSQEIIKQNFIIVGAKSVGRLQVIRSLLAP